MDIDKKKFIDELNKKYPELDVTEVEFGSNNASMYVKPNSKTLAFLEKDGVKQRVYKESSSTITRDSLARGYLDLVTTSTPYDADPHELFERALQYYYNDPIIKSVTNVLASMAAKGFENDIDDEKIKNFYDVWAFDINFEEFLEWLFLDFFRTSHVTTYKVVSKYEPRVSNLSPVAGKKIDKLGNKEKSAKKNKWSKSHIPTGYTILNPLLVNVSGNLLFNQTTITLTPPKELSDLLKKPSSELTEAEKKLIQALPNDLKKAAEDGEEYQLDSSLVGSVTYRKAPYERYARPKLSCMYDDLEYKRMLKDADKSTLDGISNYILKITIGNDDYPVTSQQELEAVAELFNTTSKSFDVVWNHTLKVEKIVSPEIEAILGKDKYDQVNEDITGGTGVTRALIDGTSGANAQEIEYAVKSVREEIDYARRTVTRWIYNEYKDIAEALGFDRIPKVRWDDSVLRDDILYKNVIAQMVDRRMLSYQTALETLGFDYQNELTSMKEELPLVSEGVFGIIGSPFQQSKGMNPQGAQNAPEGTPSNGRPTGQTNVKQPNTDPNKDPDNKVKNPKKSASLLEVIKNMDESEFANFKEYLNSARENNS